MTICEVCGEIDMNTIGGVCRDCRAEREEWNCKRCGYLECICCIINYDDDEESEP